MQKWYKWTGVFENKLKCQAQLTPKTIRILTKVFCTSGPNLVVLAWTGDELLHGQAQNGVNFEVEFDLEGQGQSPLKTIRILTKVVYICGLNLVILAWAGEMLSHGQIWWQTDRRTDRGNNNSWRPILASGKTVWQTDRQTDGKMDRTYHRAAWSQVKTNIIATLNHSIHFLVHVYNDDNLHQNFISTHWYVTIYFKISTMCENWDAHGSYICLYGHIFNMFTISSVCINTEARRHHQVLNGML